MATRSMACRLRPRGHRTDPEALLAASWIYGVLLVGWALGVGTFIALGGPSGFRSETYEVLLSTFHRCPRLLGITLLAAGAVAGIGAWFDLKWPTRIGFLLCAAWHFAFFGYTLPANLGLFGNANLINLAMLFIGLLYPVQLMATWKRTTS